MYAALFGLKIEAVKISLKYCLIHFKRYLNRLSLPIQLNTNEMLIDLGEEVVRHRRRAEGHDRQHRSRLRGG